MVKTWVAVNLIECGRNVVVPMKFVFTMNRWAAYNRRINRNQVYLVFYSSDSRKNANFYLPRSRTFADRADACYYAQLLQCFGSFDEASAYAKWRRPIAPAIYNPRRLKEKPRPVLNPHIQILPSIPPCLAPISSNSSASIPTTLSLSPNPPTSPSIPSNSSALPPNTLTLSSIPSNMSHSPLIPSSLSPIPSNSLPPTASSLSPNPPTLPSIPSNSSALPPTALSLSPNPPTLPSIPSNSTALPPTALSLSPNPPTLPSIPSNSTALPPTALSLSSIPTSSSHLQLIALNLSPQMVNNNVPSTTIQPQSVVHQNIDRQGTPSRQIQTQALRDITNTVTMMSDQSMQPDTTSFDVCNRSLSNCPSTNMDDDIEMLLIGPENDANDEVKSEQASDHDLEEDDDVVFVTPLDECIIHKPNERKHDTLSGLIPFKLNMSGDRVFTIKGKTCTIPKYIVNNLKAFNTSSAFRDSAAYDRSFVNVLLVTLVKVHNLKNSDIEDHVMQFIRELYGIRVHETQSRLEKFDDYVQEKCIELSRKY